MEREPYRMKIPDDDAHNWITTLHELGFTDKEIDEFMTRLNDTYAEQKFGKELVDFMTRANEQQQTTGGIMTDEETRQLLRERVIDYLRGERKTLILPYQLPDTPEEET